MFLKFILLGVFFYCQNIFAVEMISCEKLKLEFLMTQKIQVVSSEGKILKYKQETYPLVDDWSEALDEIVLLKIKGNDLVAQLKVQYFDKNKKMLLENEFKVEKNVVLKFDINKVVKSKETRPGELHFLPIGKDKKIICQQVVAIHHADQLDK